MKIGQQTGSEGGNTERCQNKEIAQSCVTSDLAAAFCSCLILMASSFTGLGIKVMSAPSFTSRPIHQSLLYFCVIAKCLFLKVHYTLNKIVIFITNRLLLLASVKIVLCLTSFMCRKSLVSKLIAAPWTGQSSSRAPQ